MIVVKPKEQNVKSKRLVYLGVVVAGIAAFLASWPSQLSSQQGTSVSIDNDDIGGVVTSAKGPEAGVWVIAETTDLPTRFARMVVTDDHGRYVLPDLPKANYNIWVRGYGLVDSPKVKAAPGKTLNLKAVVAPNEAAAAQYYPAIYWYSMMKIPDKSEFGGKGKIPEKLTQNEYLNLMKSNGCANCHSQGVRAMRTFPAERAVSSGQVRQFRGGVVSPHPVGTRRRTHVRDGCQGTRWRSFPLFRGLDGPHRQGRAAPCEAAAAAGCRAQHRRHHLGLARRQALPSRPDRLGPALSDGQCLRSGVRLHRAQHRYYSDPRSENAHRHELPDPGARPGYPCRNGRKTDAALALLGRRTDLDEQGEQPQRHVRPEGTRVVCGGGARSEQSGLLQEGLGPSFGQSLSGGALEPTPFDARSQDA